MAGVQRIVGNGDNRLLTAMLSASDVRPSAGLFPLAPTTARSGSGSIRLSGGYTGLTDSTLDVEIAATTGADRISEPVLTGVGNGAFTVTGLGTTPNAQTLTLTLVSLGTATTHASVDFYGVQLRAKASGTTGNLITVSATAALTLSGTAQLIKPWSKGTDSQTGAEWDFGATALLGDGSLPLACTRLAIGAQYPIYRHYKAYKNGAWNYYLSPAPPYDLGAYTPVRTVTGTYTVTVTDGTTPETYTGIVSLYDLLKALARSDLIEVVGSIADDRVPGGQNGQELPLVTAAYAAPPTVKGSEYVTALELGSVDAGAATEVLTITCTDNGVVGAELWSVVGSQAGNLDPAQTGSLYTRGPVQFTIPQKYPPAAAYTLDVPYIDSVAWKDRAEDAGVPAICIDRPRLGAQLKKDQTLTLTWTQRPEPDCDCSEGRVSGGPSEVCLGIKIDEEDSTVSSPAWYTTRLASLYSWRASFIAANTGLSATTGLVTTIAQDIELCNRATQAFHDNLDDLLDFYQDATPAGAVTTAWDAALTALDNDLTQLEAIEGVGSYTAWAANTSYSASAIVIPTAQRQNGHYYQLVTPLPSTITLMGVTTTYTGFTSGLEEPAWPTNGESITETGLINLSVDGIPGTNPATLTWQDRGPIGDADIATTADPATYRRTVDQFVLRYSAKLDYILALAGGSPSPKSSASSGDGCWRDLGDAYYWVITGGDKPYLPVFNGVYYHSAVCWHDPVANCEKNISTHEFGFGLRVGCADRLKAGDQIVIKIQAGQTAKAYAVDDQFVLTVQAAAPLPLSGGATGNDTLTWTVQSDFEGPFSDYAQTATPPEYTETDIHFKIENGSIPYELGDVWTVTLGGATVRWRWGTGAWTTPVALEDTLVLGNGITATFADGPAPSWVASDQYNWRIEQPYGPAALLHPVLGLGHEWPDSPHTITADLGSVQTLTATALALHTLPTAATVTLEGGTTLGVWAWSETLPVRATGLYLFTAVRSARYVRLTLTDAEDARLGWWWLGAPWQPGHSAAVCTLTRSYRIAKGQIGGVYLASGYGGELGWEAGAEAGGWLDADEVQALLALIDAAKQAGDEPLLILPNQHHEDEAFLATVDSQTLVLSDYLGYQASATRRRFYSLTLPLAAFV